MKLNAVHVAEYFLTSAGACCSPPDARRRELIWFLQWHGRRDAGFSKLAAQLIELYADRFGTVAMRNLKGKAEWTPEECWDVWSSIYVGHDDWRSGWSGTDFESFSRNYVWGFNSLSEAAAAGRPDSRKEWEKLKQRDECSRSYLHEDAKVAIARAWKLFNRDYFHDRSSREISQELAKWLTEICTQSETFGVNSESFCFTELPDCLLAFMDRHAQLAVRDLAQTTITEKVFKRLRFAQSQKQPVLILGDSRLGKTASISTWVNMRPGAVRLVTIPPDNREWDFFAAHADALGIPYDTKTNMRELKRQVEFVLEHWRGFLVYDEFQFAVPVRYSRNTVPHRLNWIRGQVIDRGLGCAFVATRQSYHKTLDRFLQATQYQIEQWAGRVVPALILDADIENEDMLAVAIVKYPDVNRDLLKMVVLRCAQKGTGLQHLPALVSYARFLSQESGRNQVNLADIDAAFTELLRSPAPALPTSAPKPAPRAASAPVPPPIRRASAIPAPSLRRETISSPDLSSNRVGIQSETEVETAG